MDWRRLKSMAVPAAWGLVAALAIVALSQGLGGAAGRVAGGEGFAWGAGALGPHRFIGRELPKDFFVSRAVFAQQPFRDSNLTQSPSDDREPVFGPAGDLIAFASNGVDSNQDGRLDATGTDYNLWTMRRDGTNLTQVTTGTANDREPTWFPNGRSVAFVSDRTGQGEIWVRDLVTGTETQMTSASAPAGVKSHPTVGGQGIFFACATGGSSDIWFVRVDGTNLTRLTYDGAWDGEPSLSPDLATVAFVSDRSGTRRIWTIPAANIVLAEAERALEPNCYQRTAGGGVSVVDEDPSWRAKSWPGESGYILFFTSTRAISGGDTTADRNVWAVGDVPSNPESEGLWDSDPEKMAVIANVDPADSNADFWPSASPIEESGPMGAIYNEVGFVSDRTGNNDIWLTKPYDTTPPLLMELPKTLPLSGSQEDAAQKEFNGAQPVKITARVEDDFDRWTTVGGQRIKTYSSTTTVYAIVRVPDTNIARADSLATRDQERQTWWETSYTGQYVGANLLVDIAPPGPWRFADNPRFRQADNEYVWPVAARAYLYDDGLTHQSEDGTFTFTDEVAGDGVYTAGLRAPYPSQPGATGDRLLDIEVVDEAGNFLRFDNVWGFTTEPFVVQQKILVVTDYANGQEFPQLAGPYGRYEQWREAEPYLTHKPWDSPFYGQWEDNLRDCDFGPDDYDHWRTICRGKVPRSVLTMYLPRLTQQPDPADPSKTVAVSVAERAAIWAAPYVGDAWVGAGTILDSEVQEDIRWFVENGGRILLTGQDIGWGLTNAGTTPSTFLEQVFGARYLRDAAMLPDNTPVPTPSFTLSAYAANDPVSVDPWGGGHWWTPEAIPKPDPPDALHTGPWFEPERGPWYSDVCWNQYWPDQITPVNSIPVYYYTEENREFSPGNASSPIAGVRKVHSSGAKTLFFAFGLEGVSREYHSYSPGGPWCNNYRGKVLHNALCWMRTGRAFGTVYATEGNKPLENVVVKITGGGVTRAGVTNAEGRFLIDGLEPAGFSVTLYMPGYEYTHGALGGFVHGAAQVGPFEYRMTATQPGSISGKVTEKTGAPILGATVTATIKGTPDPTPFSKSATTDAEGNYVIAQLPTGLYDVTASAPQHSSATKTDIEVKSNQNTPNVDFVLDAEPGTLEGTVRDATTTNGIAGATVAVFQQGSSVGSVTTDDTGHYTFPDAPVGEVSATASAPGYGSQTKTAQIQSGQTTTLDFDLQPVPPGTISGKVRSALEGTAIGGVTVVLRSGGVVRATTTSAATYSTGSGGYQYNYQLAAPAGTYEVSAESATLTATPAQITATVTSGQETRDINFDMRALQSFLPGISMISFPYDYAPWAPLNNPLNLLGLQPSELRFATWVPTLNGGQGGYAEFPTAPTNLINVGVGYWIGLTRAADVARAGDAVPTDQAYRLPLRNGWNMIGDPFPFGIDWLATQVEVVDAAGTRTLSLPKALAEGWLANGLWTWTGSTYQVQYVVQPWRGYWVRANVPAGEAVTLLLPPGAQASALTGQASSLRQPEEGWLVRLAVVSPPYEDRCLILGEVKGATAGYDRMYDAERPPQAPVAQQVRAYFPRPQWGAGEYAVDMRGVGAGLERWEFVVACAEAGRRVRVEWPEMVSVPKSMSLRLVDVDGGPKVDMRTSGGYEFEASEAGLRRFAVEARQMAGLGLVVTQLTCPATRGSAAISFSVSQEAAVTVEILSLAGQRVRLVALDKPLSAGQQTVTWDGLGDGGQTAPPGTYTVVVTAQGANGERYTAQRLMVRLD